MPVQHIQTFLVHPGRGASRGKVDINGAVVELTGKMFDLLSGVYEKSVGECNIEITFSPTDDGKQQNDCRDLLVAYVKNPSLDTGRTIAERLRDHTDGRSGLGLLFLIYGKEGAEHKVVFSRFPTDSAIQVDEDAKKLTVSFLERVFMKNKFSYKAVLFQDRSPDGGFWSGKAVDKQINDPTAQLSDYWIANFLYSRFTLTGAAGTFRFAVALREAVNKAPTIDIKQELVSAANLAKGLAGKPISIDSFMEQYNLSVPARDAVITSLKNPKTSQETFNFDLTEFRNFIAYRSVELDNGAILTAGTELFDTVFHQKPIDRAKGEVEFSTQGKVVDDKFKKQR